MDWLPLIILGATAFVATNADDALLILLFFGDRRFRARHVFIGQAVGIGLLVLISLAGAWLALVLPERAIGLLGVLPIVLGVRRLIERRGATQDEAAAVASPRGAAGWQRAATVAGVALVNGGDNVGVYVPLFAARPPLELGVILASFGVMLALWTFGGYWLARRSPAADGIRGVGSAAVPWVLIGIGVAMLIDQFI